MTAVHDKFVLERVYRQSPAKVFAAFATEEAKRRWFAPPGDEWDLISRAFAFEVGASEHIEAKWKTGRVSRFDCDYHDIVPGQRIVYAYRMRIDGKPISVNLATVELHPDGAGTRLVHTETGVYLDGYEDNGSREHGIGIQLDMLGETLPD